MPATSSAGADVIVVGAGPAGSMTALHLARRGLDVLLLDRAAFPRAKPCGDCLSAAATGLLRDVGLLDRVRYAGASEIDYWKIVVPGAPPAIGRFGPATALALERRRLDAVLLEAAIEAGARFRQAHVVGLATSRGRVSGVRARSVPARTGSSDSWNGDRRDGDPRGTLLEAPLVVGADGLRSVVARRLDLVRRPPRLRKVSLTAHVPSPPGGLRHGEMHVFQDGCVGYAPAGSGVCNLTMVVTTAAAAPLGRTGPLPFFRHRLRSAPGLPDGIMEAVDALSPDDLLASGPFDAPTRAAVARGAALVGDAAGYYDPFTGQGIYQAMAAARLLDEAVGPVLEGADRSSREIDRALRRYARSKRRLTAPARRVQRGVEWVLARPALAAPVIARLASAPAAMDRLVAVTGDLRRPLSLLSPAVVSSFIRPPPGGPLDPHG